MIRRISRRGVSFVTAFTLAVCALALDSQPGFAVDEPELREQRTFGTSVQGRPLVAYRNVTHGGVVVMVVGVIHGDEDAGLLITDALRTLRAPAGVDLWIIPSMNPDGTAMQQRGNANMVDLNRNFPLGWAKMGDPGYWQYAGPSRASEVETQAMVKLVREIRPTLGIWYHQDLNMISPGTGFEGRVRARYGALTGLPLVRITGGRYTGVAATWQRNVGEDSMAFVVELGPTLTSQQALVHAQAVMSVARMVQRARS
ncbi:MAG: M14 family metallopeptidase [Ilumatobacteraceae bacterium]